VTYEEIERAYMEALEGADSPCADSPFYEETSTMTDAAPTNQTPVVAPAQKSAPPATPVATASATPVAPFPVTPAMKAAVATATTPGAPIHLAVPTPPGGGVPVPALPVTIPPAPSPLELWFARLQSYKSAAKAHLMVIEDHLSKIVTSIGVTPDELVAWQQDFNAAMASVEDSAKAQFAAAEAASKASAASGSLPVIASLSPTSGPVGASVIIKGTGFGASMGGSTVTFAGASAPIATATPSVWSDTEIDVVVPSFAYSGPVTVTVGGAACVGPSFTVVSA
jgi:hypothetical protein